MKRKSAKYLLLSQLFYSKGCFTIMNQIKNCLVLTDRKTLRWFQLNESKAGIWLSGKCDRLNSLENFSNKNQAENYLAFFTLLFFDRLNSLTTISKLSVRLKYGKPLFNWYSDKLLYSISDNTTKQFCRLLQQLGNNYVAFVANKYVCQNIVGIINVKLCHGCICLIT